MAHICITDDWGCECQCKTGEPQPRNRRERRAYLAKKRRK